MAIPEYTIKRSPKARNIRLRVTPEQGLCVVVPREFDSAKIPPILKRKKTWIADALQRAAQTRRFLEPRPILHLPHSMKLLAIDESWIIEYREDPAKAGIRLHGEKGALTLTGSSINRDAVIRKLKEWLRLRVRDRLFPVAKTLAEKHRLPVHKLLVKSQRTRWASCSARKNLSLNTKLLFLPPELVRYVILHELCHIHEMNHSRRFWLHVQSVCPDYRALDARLRDAWKTLPGWVIASHGVST